ncbi:hypothetical protein AAVH_22214, partial [Aphelenchoides avenae]
MLLTVVLLFALHLVSTDALGEADKAFVMGSVKCKEPRRPICLHPWCRHPERASQTIEIEVGQEKDDVFTIIA